jgi:hypothetical protein
MAPRAALYLSRWAPRKLIGFCFNIAAGFVECSNPSLALSVL